MANYGFNLIDVYAMFERPPIGAKRLLIYDMLGVYFLKLIQA